MAGQACSTIPSNGTETEREAGTGPGSRDVSQPRRVVLTHPCSTPGCVALNTTGPMAPHRGPSSPTMAPVAAWK